MKPSHFARNAAIALGLLVFAAAVVVGLVLSIPKSPQSIEEWTPLIIKDGATPLLVEQSDEHFVFVYRAEQSELGVCVVHPAAEKGASMYEHFQSVDDVNGGGPDPFVQVHSQYDGPDANRVKTARYRVNDNFVGAFKIEARETLTSRSGASTSWNGKWQVAWK